MIMVCFVNRRDVLAPLDNGFEEHTLDTGKARFIVATADLSAPCPIANPG